MSKTEKKEAQAPKAARRLIAQYQFQMSERYMEHPKGRSMTVPDETMSIREIMTKHVSGIRIGDSLQREGVYNNGDFDSFDLEKLKNDDLTVKAEVAEYFKKHSDRLRKEIADSKKPRIEPTKPVPETDEEVDPE